MPPCRINASENEDVLTNGVCLIGDNTSLDMEEEREGMWQVQ